MNCHILIKKKKIRKNKLKMVLFNQKESGTKYISFVGGF